MLPREGPKERPSTRGRCGRGSRTPARTCPNLDPGGSARPEAGPTLQLSAAVLARDHAVWSSVSLPVSMSPDTCHGRHTRPCGTRACACRWCWYMYLCRVLCCWWCCARCGAGNGNVGCGAPSGRCRVAPPFPRPAAAAVAAASEMQTLTPGERSPVAGPPGVDTQPFLPPAAVA